ncbi:alpha/beta hydrolase [Sediminibacterium ginsengisoli]|uniref:Esterase/lipase n=1 Tax=Sediminibacterium ginsengisoli TaxID=413434 RepID=A0A1T4JRU2_9BACT|nr:alpha/beta fold hydrolase [Sediminibacterium ginsengisoli]SJZ32835.1 Esterase/lipase [Sediminibacterium ginsengisoli]
MRLLKRTILVIAIIAVIYLLGPHPARPVYGLTLPAVPAEPAKLDAYVTAIEAGHKIKPDNEARIVWADSTKKKTPYAIVYLHGFSASQEEGNPVHRDIAKQFGCNLYLSRLSQHGIDTADALVNLTVDNLWESAREAYAIGKQLGEKVILMGTSTGGTLALQLAAAYPEIAGLVLLSPNIAINDPNAWILNNHWGVQVARLVKKSKFNTSANQTPVYKQYWTSQYRLEAAAELQEMLETSMTDITFRNVKQPLLLLYYYKDEAHQDPVVKVSAMKEMFGEIATPAAMKKEVAIPGTENHVLGSAIVSKDVGSVEREIKNFLKDVMKLPVP